jgi:hypothetical protein
MNPCAPLAIAACAVARLLRAVIISTTQMGCSEAIQSNSSKPFVSGMITSRHTMSGRRAKMRRLAAVAVPASPMTLYC